MNTIDYFNNDQLACDVFTNKYKYKDETPEETIERLTNALAKNELRYKREIKRTNTCKLTKYGMERFGKYKNAIRNGDFEKVVRDDIYKHLEGFNKLVLGGSIISTLGTDQVLSLSNCFVINSPKDSLCGINKSINEMDNIFSRRGGVGIDLSTVRPKGTKINNAARFSDGVVTLMKHKYAESTKYIAQNGRRGALMLMYDSRGCDLLDFIRSKQDDVSITTANISVKMHDDFINAAKNNEDYILRFPVNLDENLLGKFKNDILKSTNYNELTEYKINNQTIYVKKVKAREIWDELVKCAWNKAEPGILYWDRIETYDPSSIYPDLKPIATNPCGEQPLAPYDSCRLLAYNLSTFVKNPYTKDSVLDYDKLYKAFYDTQCIGDDIVDLECEYVQRIIDSVKKDGITEDNRGVIDMWNKVIRTAKTGRRTGVGFTGLGDMYAALGVEYGSETITNCLFKTILRAQLDASTDLAIVRGEFYKNEKKRKEYKRQTNDWYEFIRENFPEQYDRMQTFGRRNVSVNTCAPTGTTSIIAQCTSGIEPLFLPFYKRKVKVLNTTDPYDVCDASGCRFKVYLVIHNGLKKWIAENHKEVNINELNEETIMPLYKESPYYNNCAQDIDYKKRVATQATIQKYITSSISSTVNMKKETTVEEVGDLFVLARELGCKGITIYRDGCRDGVLTASDKPFNQSEKDEDTSAWKRPKTLECNVLRFSNNNEKWISFVGVYHGRPYEIFTGLASKLEMPTAVDKGVIVKTKTDGVSRYDFEYYKDDKKEVICGINEIFNPEFWNYGKLLSALLRHRMPVACLIKTLRGMKFNNETINSWRNGIIRSLKKWAKDGEETGEKCPDCGEKLVFENGCKRCPNCGYSACN